MHRHLIFIAAVFMAFCVLVSGCLNADAMAQESTQPPVDPTKDTVVFKNGNRVAGKVVRKKDKVGILVSETEIQEIIWARTPPKEIRKPKPPVPAAPVVDNTICSHCAGKGHTENVCPSCQGGRKRQCPLCRGEGFDFKNCRSCGGTGVVYRRDSNGKKYPVECLCRVGDPRNNHLVRCPDCSGVGTLPCRTCSGVGKLKADCPYCVGGRKKR